MTAWLTFLMVNDDKSQACLFGHKYELRDRNTIGRHPDNTIQLLETIISKQHCVVERRGDHYVLRDLGSMNGTLVNGRRVSGETALEHGDEITIGGVRGRFETDEIEERREREDGSVGAVSQR